MYEFIIGMVTSVSIAVFSESDLRSMCCRCNYVRFYSYLTPIHMQALEAELGAVNRSINAISLPNPLVLSQRTSEIYRVVQQKLL